MNFDGLDRQLEFLNPNQDVFELACEIRDELGPNQAKSALSGIYNHTLVRAFLAVAILSTIFAIYSLGSAKLTNASTWKLTDTFFAARAVEPLFLKNVSALKVSPDKGWIAYGDQAGHLRVIDYDFEQEFALPGCSSSISSVNWSSDSQKIVAGTVDGSIILFDRPSGTQRLVKQLDLPLPVQQILFCDADRRIAAFAAERLLLVDVESERIQTKALFTSAGYKLAANQAGDRLAIYGRDSQAGVNVGIGRLFIVNLAGNASSHFEVELPGPAPGRIVALAWSADASQLFALVNSGRLCSWVVDKSSAQLMGAVYVVEPFNNAECAILKHEDESSLSVAALDRVYRIENLRVTRQTTLDTPTKYSLKVSDFGRQGEICFFDDGLGVVNVNGRLLRRRTGAYCAEATRVFCVADDTFVTLDSTRRLSLIESNDRQILSGPGESVTQVAQSQQNLAEFAVSSNEGLYLLDVLTQEITPLSTDAQNLEYLEWHPLSGELAGLNANTLFVVKPATHEVVQVELPCNMFSIAWHPERSELVMGPNDYRHDLNEPGTRWVHNGVYVWSFADPVVKYIELDDVELRDNVSVSFSQDGNTLIAGSHYAQIVVYDWSNRGAGFELAGRNRRLPQHVDRIDRFLWHPREDNRLFSGSRDSTLCEWDLETSTVVARHRFHRSQIKALKLSHNEKSVCSADASGNLFVWDVNDPTNRNYCRIPWPINDVCWDATDNYLLVCHSLGITKVDVETMSIGNSILFQEDGGHFALGPNLEPIGSVPDSSPFRSRGTGLVLATGFTSSSHQFHQK